jgi:DNA-directed RNA polymerase specialized sigma24 family protein
VRPEAVTEAELGALARAGDADALAALLERCRPALYAMAIGLLGSRADALDALQDTYVTALVRIGDCATQRPPERGCTPCSATCV